MEASRERRTQKPGHHGRLGKDIRTAKGLVHKKKMTGWFPRNARTSNGRLREIADPGDQPSNRRIGGERHLEERRFVSKYVKNF